MSGRAFAMVMQWFSSSVLYTWLDNMPEAIAWKLFRTDTEHQADVRNQQPCDMPVPGRLGEKEMREKPGA